MAVPYHLDERLAAIGLGVPLDRDVAVKVPAADAWHRMSALYEHVARVEPSYRNRAQVVVSADCTTSYRTGNARSDQPDPQGDTATASITCGHVPAASHADP